MKRINWIKLSLSFLACVVGIVGLSISAKAQTINDPISGYLYEFPKNGNYTISPNSAYTSIGDQGTLYGLFSIDGNLTKTDNYNGYITYEVESDNVMLKYVINRDFFKESDTKRYAVFEKKKKLYGEKLDSKIASGTIILQTSKDGENWYTDTTLYDVGAEGAFNGNIYLTKDIQQVNGCYYRVIVGYKTNKKNEKKNDYKKYVEVYQFYLVNSAENAANFADPGMEPKMNLGSKEGVKTNSGYAVSRTIGVKDPHYGWDIGQFYVNGYTRDTKDADTGDMVFLKNVGDRVTLWFRLNENIDALRGNDKLSIVKDKKGYNQEYQIERTGMGRGTLIINFIGKEGSNSEQRKPIIYTDYLEANARTGADTKVELFEEGDYEVVLDYKIKKKNNFLFFPKYYDYQISFKFSVRNGNCMVFPFDLETGSELSDGDITENGFYLDMAKSKYLDIDVKRTVLSGNLTEDVRFNRPAKDGDQYSEEGIYTFDVKNKYTGENTTKVIYVGSSKYLKALSKNNLSVEQLNQEITSGAVVNSDGTLSKNVIIDESTGAAVTIIHQSEVPANITELVEREPLVVQVPVEKGPTYLFDVNSVINSEYYYPIIFIVVGVVAFSWLLIIILIMKTSSQGRALRKFIKSFEKKVEKED
ncbi:MAG: hypothetical protein IKS56_04790 [Lachnospiraceae bacterium]|nr:hypothetical protein [Lachnospiraceae bacterium]